MPDPHDLEELMDDTNGVAQRIKRVLDRHQKIEQDAVNDLMLEAILENNQIARVIARRLNEHIKVHEQINIAHMQTRKEIEASIKDVSDEEKSIEERINGLEKIVRFPVNHPKIFWTSAVSIFVLMNFWFISGFRQLVLQALNAPDWLIQLLVPGFMP